MKCWAWTSVFGSNACMRSHAFCTRFCRGETLTCLYPMARSEGRSTSSAPEQDCQPHWVSFLHICSCSIAIWEGFADSSAHVLIWTWQHGNLTTWPLQHCVIYEQRAIPQKINLIRLRETQASKSNLAWAESLIRTVLSKKSQKDWSDYMKAFRSRIPEMNEKCQNFWKDQSDDTKVFTRRKLEETVRFLQQIVGTRLKYHDPSIHKQP